MPHAVAARRGITRRAWWPAAKRVATWLFFALVATLVVEQARHVDWPEVFASMGRQSPAVLAAAAALAACAHVLYSTLDLFGRRFTRHGLPAHRVMATSFISFAFNLNMGSLVGAVALRFRLYRRMGLQNGAIMRIVATSMFTNWLGYAFLAGCVTLLHPFELPPGWGIGNGWLRVVGGVCLALCATYLLACAFAKQRGWRVRRYEFKLPPLRIALLQLVVSCCHWMLMAAVLTLLMPVSVSYFDVLQVMQLAAIAGVLTHVPAGIGVLETVFVALLTPQVPEAGLIGTLLVYRVLYYLVPLLVATGLYVALEARAHRR